ncbi:hypothetical protein LPJ59_006491 [Coemansia sp. RSA 2399]|nr:hypothetical protein LPJ59_006491 [Coemansia sp. RSA 2399]
MRLGSLTLSLHPFSAARWITSQSTSSSPSTSSSSSSTTLFGTGSHPTGPTSGGTISSEPISASQTKQSATAASQSSANTSHAYSTSGGKGVFLPGQVDISSPDAQIMADSAHELLESMRHRHLQLARFFQAFNEYKANPLGGAMCADMEEKIHQLALLLRRQQRQLSAVMATVEGTYVNGGHIGQHYLYGSDLEQPLEEEEVAAPPATNWLATIRVTVLKEVIDFTVSEQKRIEQSELLTRYPAKKSTPSRSMAF